MLCLVIFTGDENRREGFSRAEEGAHLALLR